MSPINPSIPDIPKSEWTAVIDALLELLKWQSDRIEQLEDEIQKLKKETRKPKFESSKMDEKTEEIDIHEELIMEPDNLPESTCFKGYRDIIVQDLIIRAHNIRYRLAEYETSAGYIVADLPVGIRDRHWGSTLHS